MTTTEQTGTTPCPNANDLDALDQLRADIAGIVALHPETAQAIREGVSLGLTIADTKATAA